MYVVHLDIYACCLCIAVAPVAKAACVQHQLRILLPSPPPHLLWPVVPALLQAHPVTGAPCHMLHPCQTATRMQLLMQGRLAEQQQPAHSKDLPYAALSAAPTTAATAQSAIAPTVPAAAAPAAAAEVAGAAVLATEVPAGAANAVHHVCTADQPLPQSQGDELLAYAQGWFSMVAPLLGLSLLPAA